MRMGKGNLYTNNMKEIPLTRGQVALVDDDDYDRISQHKWRTKVRKHTNYAHAHIKDDGVWRHASMHRFVLGLIPPGFEVDHIDKDGLNNQKSNLRICTRSQNQFNKTGDPLKTSVYKGVCWDRRSNKWLAQISKCGRKIHLGYFTHELNAAMAYDKASASLHGEFSVQSGINPVDSCLPEGRVQSSKFVGVSKMKNSGRWTAYVYVGRTRHYLGVFNVESDAAFAYDKKARELFGAQAKTNFNYEKEVFRNTTHGN